MSKRAEEAAKEIYKDGIELFGRRDKSGNLVIHPEIMVGILRNAAARGYEQAEKDLTLTVEDVLLLMHIWTELPDLQFKTLEAIAEETLKRFNEQRDGL